MITRVVGGGYRICAENFLDPLVLGRECFTIYRCPLGHWPAKRLEHEMPNIDIATPVSSAPSDRLALGVGPVRPGVAGIGGTLNPSNDPPYGAALAYACFEGNEE